MPHGPHGSKPLAARAASRVFPLSGMIEVCGHVSMLTSIRTELAIACCATIAFCSIAFASGYAHAAGCAFEPQGEARVTTVIDASSFRLDDSRQVRLPG